MQNNIILSALVWNLGFLKSRAEGKENQFSIAKETVSALNQLGFAEEVISLLKDKSSEEYKLLQQADRYTYGFSFEKYESEITSGKYSTRILSVFSQVGLENRPDKSYYPVTNLTTETVPSETSNLENKDNYKKVYESLVSDLKSIDKNLLESNFNQYLLTLLSIFEMHLSLIPSPLSEEISMYDHLSTMVAIATVLSTKDTPQEKKFALLQGDFSGIQSFIFSKQGESNKHVAKTLRAKSFFVSMATQVIAYKICNTLGLPYTSIVMNAGGKFTILSPNVDIENRIKDLKEEIINEFESITYGQTKFILAHISFEENELESNSFSKVYSKLALEFEKQKLKYQPKTIVFKNYVKDISDSEKICSICGIEKGIEKLDESQMIGIHCKQFKDWGTELTKKNFIILKNLNSKSKILESIEFKNNTEQDHHRKDGQVLFYIGEKNNIEIPFKRIANYIPRFDNEDVASVLYNSKEWNNTEKPEKDNVKTFEQIGLSAREINKDGKIIGRDHLAVLKADIDNLGQIFTNGFKLGKSDSLPLKITKDKISFSDKSSLAKVASLSRFLDYFFTAWLKNKIQTQYKNVYTIFAGGDDLFLIGNYREIFELTSELIEHLEKYTGKNKDIHFSSGIILTKDKIPVYQLKEHVEEELEKSKHYTDGNKYTSNKEKKKNALTCFGVTMTNQEYSDLIKQRQYYENLIAIENISTQFLFKILTFIRMNEDLKNPPKKINPRSLMWRPLFSYHVYREYTRNTKKTEERKISEEAEKQQSKISKEIETYSAKLILPINLVLYKYRS